MGPFNLPPKHGARKARQSASAKKAAAQADAKADAKPQEGLYTAMEPKAKRRRQLGRRRTDEQVERNLAQHLSHVPCAVLETARIDGLPVREKIKQDLQELRESGSGLRLGATYWRELVAKVEGGGSVSDLKVDDPTEEVCDTLVTALGMALKANPAQRSSEPLTALLQTTRGLNDKEMVGLVRAVTNNPLVGKSAQDAVFLELAKMLARLGHQDRHKGALECVLPAIDSALSKQWQRLHKAGVTVTTWVTTHYELAVLVMDKGDLDVVVQAAGDWLSVSNQVHRLKAGSCLGAALFDFAAQMVTSMNFGKDCRAEKQCTEVSTIACS